MDAFQNRIACHRSISNLPQARVSQPRNSIAFADQGSSDASCCEPPGVAPHRRQIGLSSEQVTCEMPMRQSMDQHQTVNCHAGATIR